MNIFVSGGASGLGRAITETAAAAGGQVFFSWCSSVAAAQEIETAHANAHGIQCDFTDADSLAALLSQIDSLELDALVNNAATPLLQKHFHKTTAAEFSGGFAGNVLPLIQLTERVLAGFRKQRSGRIVTILSSAMYGLPPVGWSAYVAEKAYVASLAKSWTKEYAKFGIVANCIAPSFMQTRLTEGFDDRVVEAMIQQTPLKRLLQVQEVADTVMFLLHASPYINGQTISMDGGVAGTAN